MARLAVPLWEMNRISLPLRVRRLLALALTASAVANGVEAADPFYEERLRDGQRALLEDRLDDAVLELEIACFGLLEDPALLGEGLGHLAVAQSRMGDSEALALTLERLLTLEERHQGYSSAELAPGVRDELERILIDEVATARLSRLDAFEGLAERREERALLAGDTATRRRLLEERLAEAPDDVETLQRLADLELSDGRPREALLYLDALLDRHGSDGDVVCRRVEAALAVGDCAKALGDLSRCAEASTATETATPVLACLLEASELDRAEIWIASVDPSIRQATRFRRLERQLERRRREQQRLAASEAPPEVTAAAAAEPATATAASDATRDAPAIASDDAGEPAADRPGAGSVEAEPPRARLEALGRQINGARGAEQVNEALSAALDLATTYPSSAPVQFLAGAAAYRASQWRQAVQFFEAGGDPGAEQADLLFYKAVSLYEIGEARAAASCLERALPHLEQTAFVKAYAERILAASDDAG